MARLPALILILKDLTQLWLPKRKKKKKDAFVLSNKVLQNDGHLCAALCPSGPTSRTPPKSLASPLHFPAPSALSTKSSFPPTPPPPGRLLPSLPFFFFFFIFIYFIPRGDHLGLRNQPLCSWMWIPGGWIPGTACPGLQVITPRA